MSGGDLDREVWELVADAAAATGSGPMPWDPAAPPAEPSEVPAADIALARRVHQVVGYVPAGFGDVLRLLRHPDIEDATRAALTPRLKDDEDTRGTR